MIAISLFLILISSAFSLDIEDFGARSNDSTLKTALLNGAALNAALLAANLNSASDFTNDKTVIIQKGKVYYMLPAGPVTDLTDVTLELNGEIWAWGDNQSNWPKDSNGNVLPLISLTNTSGLVIKGTGLIEGRGYAWWWKTILTGKDNRPVLLDISTAKNTFIDGITLRNSPKYHMDLSDMLNATVQNIKIHDDITDDKKFLTWLPTFPLNTDGIDISGRDIVFRNLTIQCFDDAVAVKPSRTNKGKYSNCTENLIIEDSYVKYGVGMSIGSVPPNDNLNCIRNVTIRNVKFDYPLKAIYIKPNPGTHGAGIISNILYENIEIHNALWWAIWIGPQQQNQPGGYTTGCSFLYPLPGKKCPTNPLVTMDAITLRNVNIYGGLLSPGILLCNSTNPCTNFEFDRVNVYDRSFFPVVKGFLCHNVQGIVKNSNLYPDCLTYVNEEKKGFLAVDN
jgi:polygalacturonase